MLWHIKNPDGEMHGIQIKPIQYMRMSSLNTKDMLPLSVKPQR